MSHTLHRKCKSFHFGHGSSSQVNVKVLELLDPDFGLYVWPSALVMAEYLYSNRSKYQGTPESPKIVLELGAGTALPSLLLGKLSQASGLSTQVIATDRAGAPRILENIQQAIASNSDNAVDSLPIQVCELAWGDLSAAPGGLRHVLNAVERITQVRGGVPCPGKVNYIIGSDTFYHPPDFEPLLATVSYVIQRHNPGCVFITTYQDRSVKRNMAHLLGKWGLEAQVIEWSQFDFDMDKYLLDGAQDDVTSQPAEDIMVDQPTRRDNLEKSQSVLPLVNYSSGSDSEEDEEGSLARYTIIPTDKTPSRTGSMSQRVPPHLQQKQQPQHSASQSLKKTETSTMTDHRIADGGSLSSVALILIRKRW
ncbi:Methyltransferase-like protein 23 [Actinomortierella ambigua]|nr:Methyltransferase-like protein 23 [Actinomortierella ambigua]